MSRDKTTFIFEFQKPHMNHTGKIEMRKKVLYILSRNSRLKLSKK